MPRDGYFTASQFAAAIGMNPYTSRSLLCRRLRGEAPPFAGNEATAHGNAMEPVAIGEIEAQLGVLVDGRQGWYERAFGRHQLGTHVDGVAVVDGGDVIVEVKCPVSAIYEDVPSYYLPQIIGQQWLSGIHRTYFASYRERALAVWEVGHCPQWCEWMIGELVSFLDIVESGAPLSRRKPIVLQFPHNLIRRIYG